MRAGGDALQEPLPVQHHPGDLAAANGLAVVVLGLDLEHQPASIDVDQLGASDAVVSRGLGCKCSIRSPIPTLMLASSSSASIAAQVACPAQVRSRDEARTGTSR